MRDSAILATILMSMKSGLPCDDEDDCLREDDDLVEDDPPTASGSISKASVSDFSSRWSLEDIIQAQLPQHFSSAMIYSLMFKMRSDFYSLNH